MRLRRQRRAEEISWRPECAILPSGLSLDAAFLRSTKDPIIFSEMFGVFGTDAFTQQVLREGYANLAELTHTVIRKAMSK